MLKSDHHHRLLAVRALGNSKFLGTGLLQGFDQLFLADVHTRLLRFLDQLI